MFTLIIEHPAQHGTPIRLDFKTDKELSEHLIEYLANEHDGGFEYEYMYLITLSGEVLVTPSYDMLSSFIDSLHGFLIGDSDEEIVHVKIYEEIAPAYQEAQRLHEQFYKEIFD